MKQLLLRNQQRVRAINSGLLRQVTRDLLEKLSIPEYEISIQIISAKKMAALNQHYLQHEGSTDVITFDYQRGYDELKTDLDGIVGEIYISIQDAVAQASEFRTSWQEELTRYVIHGVLHLAGYDDLTPRKRKEMKQMENRLLLQIMNSYPLKKLGS